MEKVAIEDSPANPAQDCKVTDPKGFFV